MKTLRQKLMHSSASFLVKWQLAILVNSDYAITVQHSELCAGLCNSSKPNSELPFLLTFSRIRTSAPRQTLIEIMSDDQQQESQMTAKMQQYHLESVKITKEFDHLLTTTDQFKVSLEKDFEFKLQNKSFKIHQTVSCSSDTKKKTDPKHMVCGDCMSRFTEDG